MASLGHNDVINQDKMSRTVKNPGYNHVQNQALIHPQSDKNSKFFVSEFKDELILIIIVSCLSSLSPCFLPPGLWSLPPSLPVRSIPQALCTGPPTGHPTTLPTPHCIITAIQLPSAALTIIAQYHHYHLHTHCVVWRWGVSAHDPGRDAVWAATSGIWAESGESGKIWREHL